MASINLSYTAVQNSCVSQIDNAINSIDQALRILQGSSIPWDFSRKETLKNIYRDLSSQKKALLNIKEIIVASNKNYDSLIDKLSQQANKLPVSQEKRRGQIV